MVKERFERLLHGEVVLDLCFHCHGIWFDEFESVQITPGSVVELFKLIHQHRDDQRLPLSEPLACPRCNERMLHGLDVSRHGGKFNYHRCLQKHGRFTTFAQFMIEKGFVRQLSAAEISELAAKVGTVRCTGCGAPIDIRATMPAAIAARRSPSSIPQRSNRRWPATRGRSQTHDARCGSVGRPIVMREKESRATNGKGSRAGSRISTSVI